MDRTIFFNKIRGPIFGGGLSQSQVDGLNRLLDAWERYFRDGPLNELAYDLATATHETGREMQPIMERGDRAYFNKYEPGTKLGRVLGNTKPGDGYRYRGAGDVQNTGRRNASVATNRINQSFNLNVDLVNHPEQRLDPMVSAISLFLGNREGWWTGKDINDYIDDVDEEDDEDLREFANARGVVNGTDKAVDIGKMALHYEAALKAAGYRVGRSVTPDRVTTVPTPRPDEIDVTTRPGPRDGTTTVVVEHSDTKPGQQSYKPNKSGVAAVGAIIMGILAGLASCMGGE